MSLMDPFNTGEAMSPEFKEDEDIQTWLKMGRMAMFFSLWVAMALPILLIIAVRF